MSAPWGPRTLNNGIGVLIVRLTLRCCSQTLRRLVWRPRGLLVPGDSTALDDFNLGTVPFRIVRSGGQRANSSHLAPMHRHLQLVDDVFIG